MAKIDLVFNSTEELRKKSRTSIFIVESRKKLEKALKAFEDDLTDLSLKIEKLSLKAVNHEIEPEKFVMDLLRYELTYATVNEEYNKIKMIYQKWFLNNPIRENSQVKKKPVLKKEELNGMPEKEFGNKENREMQVPGDRKKDAYQDNQPEKRSDRY